jgi:NAD(P)H-hydrate repair Nnr-like enzyme with NAD(P)H-hydrate epimerase domain
VVTWGPGGNLPPLLAAARLMAARGHRVRVLASAATRADAERDAFDVHGYVHAPDPDPAVPFERQAQGLMAVAAGAEVAYDVRDLVAETRSSAAIVDCMLPAGLAGATAAGVRTASLVHFPYAWASAWTRPRAPSVAPSTAS